MLKILSPTLLYQCLKISNIFTYFFYFRLLVAFQGIDLHIEDEAFVVAEGGALTMVGVMATLEGEGAMQVQAETPSNLFQ